MGDIKGRYRQDLVHMVSMCQEQHSIMNFAVTFLKMLALYMLWRAQILTDLHAVFCVHQIRISVPPQAKNLDQKVSRKNRILPLKIVFFWVFDNDNILSSKSYTVTKSGISPQGKLGSLRNFRLFLIRYEVISKFFFVKIRARIQSQEP